jgi:tetratricopeptide (TPR) repeat protein
LKLIDKRTLSEAGDMDPVVAKELAELTASENNYEKLLKALTRIEELRLRVPELVCRAGGALLANHRAALGDTVWSLSEKVFMSALDCHYRKLSNKLLTDLKTQFPLSQRVKRLEGLNLEATGHSKEAMELYDKILNDDPSDAFAWKRKVCVWKSNADTDNAIKELNAYLKIFASDSNSWQELADLYIGSCRYELAKFCMEELIMLCPENYLYHLQYAEVLYTLGGKNYVALARQYFAQAIELKPQGNVRALYGLVMCLRHGSTSGFQDKLNVWAVAQLKEQYAASKSPLLKALVEEFCSETLIRK